MKFTELPIPGAYTIDIEPVSDERGFFARTWCREEFSALGLREELAQCSISFNQKRGTLRGMHFQAAPHAETKIVRCTRGRVFDVLIDLRPASPMFERWVGVTLSAESHTMVYVPEGCAHGLLTLEDETELFYQMSAPHVAGSARGARWNDPRFGIEWPETPGIVSERDRTWPDFEAP